MNIKIQKLDGYQECGSTTPYAKKDQSSCISCPKDKPLFNLGMFICFINDRNKIMLSM